MVYVLYTRSQLTTDVDGSKIVKVQFSPTFPEVHVAVYKYLMVQCSQV